MFVYIVECSDKSYYTGVTNNAERRIVEHNLGLDIKSYTYKRRPVVLKFCGQCDSPIQGIEFEKQLKGWNRKKKEALFKSDWNKIKELAKSYSAKKTPSHPEPVEG